jgi:hypothetical protein
MCKKEKCQNCGKCDPTNKVQKIMLPYGKFGGGRFEIPEQDWNGTTPIFSEMVDKWFENINQLLDYCDKEEADPKTLLLMHGKPNYLSSIDPLKHYADILHRELPEIPPIIQRAFDDLNKTITNNHIPVSWDVGEYAVSKQSLHKLNYE